MKAKVGVGLVVSIAVSSIFLVACRQPPEQLGSQPELSSSDSDRGSGGGIPGKAAPEKGSEEGKRSTFKWEGDGSSLTIEQRGYLANLSIRYNNIFTGLEGKPQAEVDALGFPTAEEWLDARNLTDDELLDRARRGDVKAKAFYVDRNVARLEDLLSSSGAESLSEVFQASPAARGEYQQLVVDTQVAAAGILKFQPSPFAAYLYGHTSAVIGGMQFPYAAAIAVAGDLGDARSAALLQAYSNKVGAMDSDAVMSSYKSMRSTAGLK
ncbi:TPA: hypothetical protein ACKQBZ_000738 [Stenotrophomonas maltophilia]|uniref:hypothetical protein n=1 Tax=Stenotrophomonas forensis TaxID=2871169 RepID=UPI0018D33C6A|nr:hypothetical protein [Stenotrophomonas maltophilia]